MTTPNDKLERSIHLLVAANRILANEGVVDAYGHVSIRHPHHHDQFLLSRSLSPELVTAQDIFAESGQDWREQFEQKAIEASLIKELSKKYGVDENDIAERIAAPNKGAGEENVSDENEALK